MIKAIYKVVYDTYIGYADTIEEAKEMEKNSRYTLMIVNQYFL